MNLPHCTPGRLEPAAQRAAVARRQDARVVLETKTLAALEASIPRLRRT